MRHHRLKAEEAHERPAERECLQCNETVDVQSLQPIGNGTPIFVLTQSGMKRKATTLLRELRVCVRHHRLKAEEAHGPPAERECLQWKTVDVQSLQPIGNGISIFVLTQSGM
ncbi:hypothetical protein CVN76_21920 [Bacillus sp. mrc49]|nr:hypothetical protein CVN76_21920 [Bacillus sp. mrc49]